MPSTNDNLITLASFHTAAEAAIARGRLAEEGIEARLGEEATGTWLWHWGSTAAGVKLIVHEYDAPLARHLLGILPDHLASHADNLEQEDEDEDWAGEDWADSDGDYDESYTEEQDDPHSPDRTLKRAWYASVIGLLLFPPLLNCYSVWLVIRHDLWKPQPNHSHPNWRFFAALGFNLLGLLTASIFWRLYAL